ncbi:MAG TPA: RimK/LysX family protein [Candidatus Saccharimonadales bacterium]|nr:RimK/LysX family protein [Candidatus Saccharimonadales bacterium]
MPSSIPKKKIIGRVEQVIFPFIGQQPVHARIDTGAQTSAIWASVITQQDGRLGVVFFGKGHPLYDGVVHYFDDFTYGMVTSSNGQAEPRYKIRLSIKLGGKRIRARFTLADRSTQVYPVLIGRNILRGKFVVDVKQGTALKTAERIHSAALQSRLERPVKEIDS